MVKIGDKFKIKPEIWEKDHEQHYCKWSPKDWSNPGVVLVAVSDTNNGLAHVVPVGIDPKDGVGHSVAELIPYRKQTIIL